MRFDVFVFYAIFPCVCFCHINKDYLFTCLITHLLKSLTATDKASVRCQLHTMHVITRSE